MEQKIKWYLFDKSKGSRQKRPPVKKWVLVLCKSNREGFPDPIIVGYMKNAAGDKQSPQFITPGGNAGEAYAWCDCLPEDFQYPPKSALDLLKPVAGSPRSNNPCTPNRGINANRGALINIKERG